MTVLRRTFGKGERPPPARQASRAGRSSLRAFTLVELLVAAGITALLAGFIAVIVMNISTTWSRANSRLGADAQARIVLDQLQLDLQGAMYRDDGKVWFAVDVLNSSTGGATGLWRAAARNAKPVGSLSLQMTSPNLADARFGTAGVWLRFFTSSRTVLNQRQQVTVPAAPVAVGYQIIRRFTATNPANQDTAYLLHRAEARPSTANGRIGVLEAGFDLTASGYTTSSGTNSGGTTGDPRSIQVPGSVRNLDAVFADNVIDFGVRCYVWDRSLPGGLRLVFPATAGGALSNSASARLRGTLPSDTPVDVWDGAQPMPDVVDVMVRILTDRGAEAIANLERVQTPALAVPPKYNSNAQQWWWGVALENSRVYTRRIVLNTQPL